ncbi:hypothetical protein PFISCL1PPCAC_4085, partial [Pristionchus fissidentatus]
ITSKVIVVISRILISKFSSIISIFSSFHSQVSHCSHEFVMCFRCTLILSSHIINMGSEYNINLFERIGKLFKMNRLLLKRPEELLHTTRLSLSCRSGHVVVSFDDLFFLVPFRISRHLTRKFLPPLTGVLTFLNPSNLLWAQFPCRRACVCIRRR